MLSPSLGRVARTTCAHPASSSAIGRRPLSVLTAAGHLLTRRNQQRRNSSTSCPPDNSRGPGASQTSASSASSKSAEKKAAPRSRSKRIAPQVNVPHVPPTSYLQETDVALSSFFSAHRPISVTTSIPVASSESSFNAIFATRKRSNPSKHEHVIYTLGNAVKSLEGGAQSSEESELRAEMMQNPASNDGPVHHLDGPGPQRQLSLNELLAQMRPFNAPPPPMSFDQAQAASKAGAAGTQKGGEMAQQTRLQKPQKKIWKATLTVTESTDAAGRTTFSATTSPAIRLPTRSESRAEDPALDGAITIRQPFLERMEIREQEWRKFIRNRAEDDGRTMHAISVKRQRKLKMKKHKYKKLMKRTRNLRRRLGQT